MTVQNSNIKNILKSFRAKTKQLPLNRLAIDNVNKQRGSSFERDAGHLRYIRPKQNYPVG